MNDIKKKKHCLATVTTKSFLSATLVMISSFIERNKWFSGDVAIIFEGDEFDQSELELLNIFENVNVVHVGTTLSSNVKRICDYSPAFQKKAARFFSLEAFRLGGYDKIIFCDSDMVFMGSIEPVMSVESMIACCGDGAFYNGLSRDSESFQSINDSLKANTIKGTFNAGFMIIDGSIINNEIYDDLLRMTELENWKNPSITHTDQRILNQYFFGRQHILDASYNYLQTHPNSIATHTNLTFADIKVFHFNGPSKPWKTENALLHVNSDTIRYRAYQVWYRQFEKVLSKVHLRQVGLSAFGDNQ